MGRRKEGGDGVRAGREVCAYIKDRWESIDLVEEWMEVVAHGMCIA